MNKVRIGDIATVFDGPHATPKKIAEGPIYLGLDGITDDGRFNPSGFAHLSEDDYVIWTRRVTPQEDDIGSYTRTVYHVASHTPKRKAARSNRAGDAKSPILQDRAFCFMIGVERMNYVRHRGLNSF